MKNQPCIPRFYVNNEMTAIFDHRPHGHESFWSLTSPIEVYLWSKDEL